MRERPILMSAPMVRSILAGTKTQTRRVVKITHRTPGLAACLEPADPSWVRRHTAAELCPYGVLGDVLWVKESHRLGNRYRNVWCTYEADGHRCVVPAPELCGTYDANKLRPSIHMPRWASRITLEITDVRVERLQEITRGDCMKEGCPFPNMADGEDPREWYARLWDEINGAGSWKINPWVWALTFRRIGDA